MYPDQTLRTLALKKTLLQHQVALEREKCRHYSHVLRSGRLFKILQFACIALPLVPVLIDAFAKKAKPARRKRKVVSRGKADKPPEA
jgi:hypothetical protein